MITLNQEEYLRNLDILKYQANFILKNTDVSKIMEKKQFNSITEKNIKDYIIMCNELGIILDEYIAVKDKYNLSNEYLAELNKTKKQLNDFVFDNFPVKELFGDRQSCGGMQEWTVDDDIDSFIENDEKAKKLAEKAADEDICVPIGEGDNCW